MKKTILLFSIISLIACTPPMKSEPNKCNCTPDHCCADTVTIKENSISYPELPAEEDVVLDNDYPTHHYEEIPQVNEEIL